MKFTPEVIAALQTLKNAAENDFERHRISILEKDLTEPPKVEIVDDTHQKFNGVVYGKNKDGHYCKVSFIHRAVQNYFYGEIPCDYVVHHVDENKANNDISNLQILSKEAHNKIHNPANKTNCKPKIFVCKVCGKEYVALNTGNNCYCSSKCAEKGRSKRPLLKRTCVICGKSFTTKKFTARFCSQECIRESYRIRCHEKRICPICGTTFETAKSSRQKTCSTQCGRKLRGISHSLNSKKLKS